MKFTVGQVVMVKHSRVGTISGIDFVNKKYKILFNDGISEWVSKHIVKIGDKAENIAKGKINGS